MADPNAAGPHAQNCACSWNCRAAMISLRAETTAQGECPWASPACAWSLLVQCWPTVVSILVENISDVTNLGGFPCWNRATFFFLFSFLSLFASFYSQEIKEWAVCQSENKQTKPPKQPGHCTFLCFSFKKIPCNSEYRYFFSRSS